MTNNVKMARKARAQDEAARRAANTAVTADSISGLTADSFQNFAAKLGVGTDNMLTNSNYGFNPVTRQRLMMEWIYRGSWIGGVAVDVVADDMVRAGVEISGSLKPDEIEEIEDVATATGTWQAIADNTRWARLFGGSVAVVLIEGQDLRTPLRVETVAKGQYKGILVLDRWMVEPMITHLIQDYGPEMGLPEYYRVTGNAPALAGKQIHYSRLIRQEGITLPFNQRMQENMWGISVIERLYDRMVSFDSASLGASQLVYKSYLRTLSVDGLRRTVSENGPAMDGIIRYVNMMAKFQSIEGITLIDGKDTLEATTHSAFSGLSDVLLQFGQQLSGALQIPLVRLFGQSPAGLNSSGESDLRTYYDGIAHKQVSELMTPVTRLYRIIARSCGFEDSDLRIKFRPLWQLTDAEKSDIASKDANTIADMEERGIIDRQTALKELRQSSHVTGRFTNITDEMINEAEDEAPPEPEDVRVAAIRKTGIDPEKPDEKPPVPAKDE